MQFCIKHFCLHPEYNGQLRKKVIGHLSRPWTLSLPLFPFVGGEVLLATFSPPHLIVFSTLLCLVFFFQSSSSPAFLTSLFFGYISYYHRGIRHRVLTNQRDRSYVYAVVSLAAGGPPIPALASLVSSCPTHVTLPLSSVVCHPPSFLRVQPTVICPSPVSLSSSSAFPSLPLTPPFFSCLPSFTLAIFRTQLFSHICSLCCCSSVRAKVSVPCWCHTSAHYVALKSFGDPPVRHHSLNCSPRVRSGLYSSTYLSPSSRIRTLPLLDTRNCLPESVSSPPAR